MISAPRFQPCSSIKKGAPERPTPFHFPGGAEGDRTPGLMTASHALSQLSYSPKTVCSFNQSAFKCQYLFRSWITVKKRIPEISDSLILVYQTLSGVLKNSRAGVNSRKLAGLSNTGLRENSGQRDDREPASDRRGSLLPGRRRELHRRRFSEKVRRLQHRSRKR